MKFPYLLNGLSIERPDQVWCSDITYIRLSKGFIYLVAIMDWFSRYVISWAVSDTLEASFCLEALERAFHKSCPEIFNSDQGSQFTSNDFTGRLLTKGVRISMDGRGRVFDNIFIERLWRSLKYEEVYLNDYPDVDEAVQRLGAYFSFYNDQRLHQALKYMTPNSVYYGHEICLS
jgi:putative transposase